MFWLTQLSMHAAAPSQLCSQPSRIPQAVMGPHALNDVQQFVSAHWVHWASLALTVHALGVPPPASPPPLLVPPPMTPPGQLASANSHVGPSWGGFDGFDEQAANATEASAAATAARRDLLTIPSKHPEGAGAPLPVGPPAPLVGKQRSLSNFVEP
jgi:hypothetical protein